MKTVLTFAAFAALAAASSAQLVTNGGFETGTLAGWSTPGSTSLLSVRTSNSSFPAYEGLSCVTFGTTVSTNPNILSQSITTTVGQAYTLSFYVREDTALTGNRSLTVAFGSGSLAYTALTQTYALGTITTTATSTTTALSFTGYNAPNYYMIDGISVTPSTVPEPSALAALGLGALAMLGRRKRA